MKALLASSALAVATAIAAPAQAVTITDSLSVGSTIKHYFFAVNTASVFDIFTEPAVTDLIFALYPFGGATPIAGGVTALNDVSLSTGFYDLAYASAHFMGNVKLTVTDEIGAAVPAPATLPLLAGAVGVAGAAARRKRRRTPV